MRQLGGLEVDQDEAFEQVVIKDQSDEEVLGLGADPLLMGDEGEAFAQYQRNCCRWSIKACSRLFFTVCRCRVDPGTLRAPDHEQIRAAKLAGWQYWLPPRLEPQDDPG